MAFWQSKTLSEMTDEEWESLCDGCGKCCLHKLEDDDTHKLHYTNVACKLLNLKTCRCTKYTERTQLVSMCLAIKSFDNDQLAWLPSTCAYRLLAEGETLPDWHPLVSGKSATVVEAGVSVRSYAIAESQVKRLENHIIEWLT